MSDIQTRDLANLPPDALIRLPEVLALYPMGRSAFMDGVRAGKFPPAQKIGSRLNAWRLRDILALCRGEWRQERKG